MIPSRASGGGRLLLFLLFCASVPTLAAAGDSGNLCGACDQACCVDGELWERDCNGCCREPLFGLIRPTDICYSDFISPITNPVFFEDPRNLTEARFIYINHGLPAALGGGDLNVMALQLRAAITDRLSIIATKDGFIFAGPDAPIDDGWADVAAGLKYLIYADPDTQRLLSGGVVYEIPAGTPRAAQGNGDGEFNLFLTGGAQLGDSWHVISTPGLRLPSNTSTETQMFYWSNHLDRKLGWQGWYALTELNWYHYMSNGNGGINGIGGLDLFNLGSTNVAGLNVLTWAFGLKYKLTQLSEIGIAYEIPVTSNLDVIRNRLTFDIRLRY